MKTFAILSESVVLFKGMFPEEAILLVIVLRNYKTAHAKQDKGTKNTKIVFEVGTARQCKGMSGSAGETRNAGTLIGWIRRSGGCRILEARSCFRFIKQYK